MKHVDWRQVKMRRAMKRFTRTLRLLLAGCLLLLGIVAVIVIVVTHPDAPGPLPTSFPHIARDPAPWSRPTTQLSSLPRHTHAGNPFEVDLRGSDLSGLVLGTSVADLDWANFDTATRWPAAKQLPRNFDPHRIMELGKDPGLGIRGLHARGITGRGIAVAVIDQPLLVTHQEFAGRVRLYEDIGYSHVTRRIGDHECATMHGAATASIACGKTVGVAPEAQLYYIGVNARSFPYVTNNSITFTLYAVAVRRILEINNTLPPGEKIHVISLSIGWHRTPVPTGFEDINAAVSEAKAMNVLVTSSSLQQTHGFKFHGLDRNPSGDPDDFSIYRPGRFWADSFASNDPFLANRLLVPMDHRTLAAPGGNDQYAHYATGGWSWCTPYLAGVYALACQVDPTMTPDRFWATALKTGRAIQFDLDGRRVSLGPILDPGALMESLAVEAK
jgi:hypothetical protein